MSFKRIAAEIDEIANDLEKRGLKRYAAQLDAVSNTLEKGPATPGGGGGSGDALQKLRQKWKSEPDISVARSSGGVMVTCDVNSPKDLPEIAGKSEGDWEKTDSGFELFLSDEEAEAVASGDETSEDDGASMDPALEEGRAPMKKSASRKAGRRQALDMNALVDRSGTGQENPGSEAAHEWERYDSYDAYAAGKTNKTPMGARSVLNLVLTGRGEAPSPADLLSRLDFAQDDSHPEEGHKIMVTANDRKRKGGRRQALHMGEAAPMSATDSGLEQDLPDDQDWMTTAGMQGRMPAIDDGRHKGKFRHTMDETYPRGPDGNGPHTKKPQDMGMETAWDSGQSGSMTEGPGMLAGPGKGPPLGLAASARQARKILREAAMKAIAMEPDDLGRKDPESGESLDVADRHPYIGAGEWGSDVGTESGPGPGINMDGDFNPDEMHPDAINVDSTDSFKVPLPDDDEESDVSAGVEYAGKKPKDLEAMDEEGPGGDDDLSDLVDEDGDGDTDDEEEDPDQDGEEEEDDDGDEDDDTEDEEEFNPIQNLQKGRKKGEINYASRRRRQ